MAEESLDPSSFSPDTRDFLVLLARHQVRYLIVGGEAVIYYGYARLTGDIDFFCDRTSENVARLYSALHEFWEGTIPGVQSAHELFQQGLILQFGVPPNRIDGVEFREAWPRRKTLRLGVEPEGPLVHYIGIDDLIRNKRAAGRAKDLDDLRYLLHLEGQK